MTRPGALPIVTLAVSFFLVVGALFGLSRLSSPASPTASPSAQLADSPSPAPTPTLTPSPTPAPTLVPTAIPTATPKPALPLLQGPPNTGLSTANVATPKGTFSATILALDLSTVRVITDSANDSDCSTSCSVLPLANFVSRNGGFAGVNGTYFCPATYPECAAKTNSFDFPIYHTRLSHWINAGTLSWGGRSIFYVDGSGAHYLQNSSGFSGGLTAGIINFPGLVDGGNVQIDDNQSGLSDKQVARGTKVGIGLRDSQHIMVVVARNVNMNEFAHVFKALGATGALNLDTGGSTALISGGRYVFGPGRDLPNAVIFASK